MPTLSLDIEFRSKINLKNCGAWRYCAHASTEPLFMCWTVDDDAAVQTWRQGDPVPVPFLAATNAPADWSFVAHNYQFELPFYELILARFGFPPIPLASWHCTMRLALANAYPAELGLLSQALGLPYRKDAKAIKALREVARPKKKGGWDEDPAKLDLVHQRCVTDVLTTRAVWNHPGLRHLDEAERRLQILDAEINRRGVRIDRTFVTAARDFATSERNGINVRLSELTDGAITSIDQVQKLARGDQCPRARHGVAGQARGRGGAGARSRRDHPAAARITPGRRPFERAEVRQDPGLRQRRRRPPARHPDHVWRRDRPLDLARPDAAQLEKERARRPAVRARRRDPQRSRPHRSVRQPLGGDRQRLARRCCTPRPDTCCISGRPPDDREPGPGLGRGREWKLQLHRDYDRTGDRNLEPYRVLAAQMLNRPIEEIGANERQQGKFAELAAGFGGGVGAWRRIFDDQRPDAEIERDKIKWRQLHPQIVTFWHRLFKAVRVAVQMRAAVRVNEAAAARDRLLLRGRQSLHHPAVRPQSHLSRRTLVPGKFEGSVDLAYFDNSKKNGARSTNGMDRSSRTLCPGSRAISWPKPSSASKLAVCRWFFTGTTTASARCPKARSPTPSSWRSCSKPPAWAAGLAARRQRPQRSALSAGVRRAGRQGAVETRCPRDRVDAGAAPVVDPVEQAIDALVAEPATIAYTPGGTAHLRARGCQGRTRQPRRARSAAL